ncbi:MAG: RloB domain-containing protein [Synechococcus sp. SB0668_bin_15]|nr:RloB domain-containing protein [Synechococcus sp. SB0668_bin_15]MYC49482.1 RloB domain-containing protein [Synechococcus sp. SB0662_bin_14]
MTSWRRRAPVKEPAAVMIVVTEGEKTELRYLEVFRKIHVEPFARELGFRLEIVSGTGVPMTVVNCAIQKRQSLQRFLRKEDSVWAMFGRDDHPEFKEAKRKARDKGVYLAVSDPCFEIWGIYHYRDCQGLIGRDQCQKRLEELCSSYDRKSGKIFADEDAIKNKYRDAIIRAERSLNLREQEDNPEGNPSTRVHCLIKGILSTVEDLVHSNSNREG